MLTTTILRRHILIAAVSNALSWYNVLIFAFMTPVVAKLFFPENPNNPEDTINQILLTFAVFGIGFLMRPVGGIVVGMYSDRNGRKAAVVLVTSMIAAASFFITFAPTYEQVGIAAPAIILVARLVQGFAIGGGFGPSTCLLIEMVPPGKRGFYGSWQMTGQIAATLFATAIGTLVTFLFTVEQLLAWAWRIPFAFGMLIIPFAFYIRRCVEEPDTFKEAKARKTSGEVRQVTLVQMLMFYKRETLVGIGLVVTATISVHITFIYLTTFSTMVLKLPLRDTFLVQMACAALMVVLMPFVGAWSDRVGRRHITIGSLIGYLIVLWPLYAWLIDSPTIAKLLTVQIVVCMFVAVFFGVFGTVIAELFPLKSRSLGMSMAYNVTVIIFGGFAHFIVTALIMVTGSPMSPVYYVMFGVTLGLIAACYIKDKPDETEMGLE